MRMVSAALRVAGSCSMGSRKSSRLRRCEEGAGLLEVGAVAEVEGEGFEARWVHAEFAHDVVGGEEDAAAVDASGEEDAYGFFFGDDFEPL